MSNSFRYAYVRAARSLLQAFLDASLLDIQFAYMGVYENRGRHVCGPPDIPSFPQTRERERERETSLFKWSSLKHKVFVDLEAYVYITVNPKPQTLNPNRASTCRVPRQGPTDSSSRLQMHSELPACFRFRRSIVQTHAGLGFRV